MLNIVQSWCRKMLKKVSLERTHHFVRKKVDGDESKVCGKVTCAIWGNRVLKLSVAAKIVQAGTI
jgi:hypothetical protein